MVTLFLVVVALGIAYWLMERETNIPEPVPVVAAKKGGMPHRDENTFPEKSVVRPSVSGDGLTVTDTSADTSAVVQEATQGGEATAALPSSNSQISQDQNPNIPYPEDGFTNLHEDSAARPSTPGDLVENTAKTLETSGSIEKTPTIQPQQDIFLQEPPSILMMENSFPEGEDKADALKNDDPTLRAANRLKPANVEASGQGAVVSGIEKPEIEKSGKQEQSKTEEEFLFEEESSISDKPEKETQPDNTPMIPPKDGSGSKIALVIDDLGYNKPLSKAIAQLPADLTLAVLPGGVFSGELSELAFALGRELILHQPMQPQGYPKIKPGPGGLYSTMTEVEIFKILENNFKDFPHARGFNNHMGSQLTNERRAMDAVMKFAKSRSLFFLDSRTSTQSVAYERAIAHHVASLKRDVFIDNVTEKRAILKKLDELVTVAKRHGRAIGIGHPYQATLDALREWLPTLGNKKVEIVRLSKFLGNTPATVVEKSKPTVVREGKKAAPPSVPVLGDDRPMHHQTTVHSPKLTTVSE
ncbi:MAG: divergent polysaccharide deacetylase family protein [Nitrospirae bacterium]|nr:divergent polysaccharide deacetylase family protein [Magnetococcales bacterium]